MLRKKGGVGLKPKAPVRRNALGSSSQGPDRPFSKTVAPPPAAQQPTPAPTPSQSAASEAASTLASLSSQSQPITDVRSTIGTTALPDVPPTAPSSAAYSQAASTTLNGTDLPRITEDIHGGSDGSNRKTVTSKESEPSDNTDQGKEPVTSATASSITEAAPSSRPVTEAASVEIAEAQAIPTTGRATHRVTQPSRLIRRAAPQPRVPLPTAAPSVPTRAPEPAIPTSADQVPTPASTTPQPTESVRPEPIVAPPRGRATQAATPPIESQTNIQESIEATGDAEDNEAVAPAAKPKRAPRKRKTAAETAETTDGAAVTARAPKRARNKKAAAPAVTEDESRAETEGSQPPAPAPRNRSQKPRSQSTQSVGEGGETSAKKGGLRHRSPTPEDAEEQKVDPSQVTMGDLVKDLRIGRKFSRHDELLERQRMKKLKSKMAGGIPGGAGSNDAADSSGSAGGSKAGTPGPAHHEAGESSSSAAAAAARPLTDGAPQFQIIDGQIVVNQSTLQFDRHAAAAREAGDLEEEIEDDFTHHTTSNTYMKRQQKPNHWTAIETETFYRGLRMFGTDFALLCKMFPGKNRRHVKLKFNREERAHPAKVNAALVGVKTVGIDLDEYKSHTGLEYKSVDEIEAEQARVEEEFEAEQRRAEEQAAAEAKKRQEELFGKKEEVEKKGKGRGRRKKEGGGMGLGF